jgi:hypothetical protein
LEDYEQLLEELYKEYKGKALPYRNEKGELRNRVIKSKLALLEGIVSTINKKS